MENKQKKAYRRLTICTGMHKKRTLRYTQRTLFIRQRCPIYPHGLRNDINVFCHLTELSPLHLRLQSLRTPLSFIFHL
ncbi:hypothetical protein P4G85_17095 [Bacillus cereus]|uniref:hypothetical protein n=1 Tax=Bacillus cereus TaxID=1396 RepID=UPI001F109D4E|nr:hypothetical protein [Bacillus cereus]MEB8750026.1 hypothetical protein [Bacillus cereus]